MKNALVFLSVFFVVSAKAQTQSVAEWKVVTVIESIVPAGLGRSRMIENMTEIKPEDYKVSRTDGKTTDKPQPRRQELKVDKFDETKMLNFYAISGINFQNIASNDAMIGGRIMELAAEGWKFVFVTSGVESDAGGSDGQGIFITRMFFTRESNSAVKGTSTKEEVKE
jgi:hypothetical protein